MSQETVFDISPAVEVAISGWAKRLVNLDYYLDRSLGDCFRDRHLRAYLPLLDSFLEDPRMSDSEAVRFFLAGAFITLDAVRLDKTSVNEPTVLDEHDCRNYVSFMLDASLVDESAHDEIFGLTPGNKEVARLRSTLNRIAQDLPDMEMVSRFGYDLKFLFGTSVTINTFLLKFNGQILERRLLKAKASVRMYKLNMPVTKFYKLNPPGLSSTSGLDYC